MERIKSWDYVTNTGNYIKQNWQLLAEANNLEIEHWGLPALAGFTIKSKNSIAYKTLITQEMLKKGFLASNSIYVCIDHSNEILTNYFDFLNQIFYTINKCENGADIEKLLDGPICHGSFKRLN
jgi:glutamate-1-semialdehyde 2,1-aminomutase